MASTISKALFFLFIASALFFSCVLGGITCEQLDSSKCAFAVSSSGLRCVLEKNVGGGGREVEYSCRNSGVAATDVADWIETDECVEACGLGRNTIGISSDYLVNRRFQRRLCSSECYDSCPNVVDLYANVAAGEGVSLSKLCEVIMTKRREMTETNSSGRSKVHDAESPAAPPSVGSKIIGLYASAPQNGRKLIAVNDGEDDEAAAPV
ncbi:hypothetical protein IEQ34_019795 [Dendrobium chrysotoxum]|uniref:PAR1 protein n=1 Tax=Dendrobium chrysotoxum TaxID=161865 RepID=A0AAV7G8G5_DENCH|nr:hypothetical protein IEQ34_019795 [Dendrobium chrysotoxum]